jgi:hypothetical protein
VEDGWDKTFPNENGHVVEVQGDMVLGEENTFFAMITNYLVPTAYAIDMAVTYGPFNFGNVQEPGACTSNCYSQSSYGGGNGRRISLRDGNGSGNNTDEPVGEVLGEAISIVPVGAPNTGAGGSAPITGNAYLLAAYFTSRKSMR